MLLAPSLGEQPREIAGKLAERLQDRLGADVEKVEVAGPGFLNLFLADGWYRRAATTLMEAGDEMGRPPAPAAEDGAPEGVLVEFVSANPTGPLTAAGGRHAAYGDSVARALEFAGVPAQREYYVNDRGGQVDRFAESIAARMTGGEVPEDGYEGGYVGELGERLESEGVDPGDTDELSRRGAELMRGQIEETLRRYGVEFDTWSSERELYETGAVETGARRPPRAGPRVRERGRDVATHHRVRGRQGPGPDPLRGRVDLLPGRHRLPPPEARALGRAPARRARGRPPRLHGSSARRARRTGLGRRQAGVLDHAAGPRRRGR